MDHHFGHHSMDSAPMPMPHDGHGGHGGHDGMEHGSSCSMNMTFNWNIHGVCIIFDWWQIHGLGTMILSCVVVALITANYELLRSKARQYDARLVGAEISRQQAALNEENIGEDEPLQGRNRYISFSVSKEEHVVRSILYALQTGIGFLIMLIFMTYNGYLMFATVIGAGIGHFLFGRRMGAERALSCH
ncbi:Ctr copper transporter family-domain-containing protein [Syncephalis fuscata]|nr:Ctr copper transporter family-domain-containing protein [Syncephalis fuscata]